MSGEFSEWLIPGLLVQLWKVGEVKGFLLKTSEIPVGTMVTDNDARPSPRIGGTTLRYSPQSAFHCSLKNCTHAARHHSTLRCSYFQTECFLSRYAPQSLSFLPPGLYLGISHEPLTTSLPHFSAWHSGCQQHLPGNEMAENHSW